MPPTSRHVLRGDQCQCPSCGLLFTSTSGFDRHRTGSFASGRQCKPEAELRAAGWEPNARGFWRKAITEEQRLRLIAARTSTTTRAAAAHQEQLHG
jgi:hypothetical protein